jgi:signal transduction histidine kinase/FixJ family two-component response regulator
VGQSFQTLVEINAGRVGDHLDKQIDLLTSLSRNEAVFLTGLTAANAAYPANEAEAYRQLQEREQLWQSSPENSSFVRQYRNNPQTLALSKFRGNNAFHTNMFLTDRRGGLVAAQGKRPTKFYYGDEAWWQTAWNNDWGGIYLGDLWINPETKVASIFMAIGVLNPQTNQTIGVLASTYELYTVQRDFRAAKLQTTGDVTLMAPDGRVIASLDKEAIGRLAWRDLFTTGALSSVESSQLPAEPGWLLGINRQKKPIVAAYAPLNPTNLVNLGQIRSLGWYIVAGDTQENALAEVNRSNKFASMVGLLAMALAVIAATATARVISRPIESLTRTASAITAGHLEQQAEPVGLVELVTLAEAFNTLTARLRLLINNLQDQVAQRTAQLETRAQELARTSREAQEARAAAEAANKAKSKFLANMSHELRTPLNGILGYAYILKQDKSLNDRQREGLEIIQQSGNHLLTLLNDILDLSKIEAGRMEIEPIDFHLPLFLESLTKIMRLRAEQKGLKFVYLPFDFVQNQSLTTPLPASVWGDEKRLRQILINLLGNAVKFTRQGKVTFKVGPGDSTYYNYNKAQTDITEIDRKMRFQVEDTGVGITLEQVEAIFRPFQQVGDQKYETEGTGLGLTISRNLVEMIGGELKVKSTPGEGSVFWFEVPLPPSRSEIEVVKTYKRPIIGFRGKKRKVMVVDDNLDNRTVLVDLLSPLGFEVVEAASGHEGLEKALSFEPDAILLDMVMPIMDGFEFARQIRRSPKFRDVVIIAISANVFENDQQESLAVGCNDFVPKPIRTQMLFEALRRHLKIEWIYEEQKKESVVYTGEELSSASFVIPPASEITILYDLAMMGAIKELQAYTVKLEQSNSRYRAFLTELRGLAKSFQVDKMCEFLEPHLEKDE